MIEFCKRKLHQLTEGHERRNEVLFFIGGFAFDALLVNEIDDLFSLAQQALYLFVIAFLIHHEILFRFHKWRPAAGIWEKLWSYRNLLLHFLLGTLLNIYSIFYIKSASLVSSLVFLAFMVALIVSNELPIVKKSHVSFKVGLFAICLFSYISILYPLVLGFIGWIPFGLAGVTTAVIFYLQIRILGRKISERQTLLKAVLLPGTSVLVVFTLFYFLGWIPPVPLSVKKQGIYHLVEKRSGKYFLSTEKDPWKFWQSGDQDFKARPQDKIYYYLQIYSPARFSDQIFIQWMWKDPKHGWMKRDRLPMPILGGRKEGFRGFASKSNYQPGEWRIQVETALGHEVSRLSFDVSEDSDDRPREFTVIEQ